MDVGPKADTADLGENGAFHSFALSGTGVHLDNPMYSQRDGTPLATLAPSGKQSKGPKALKNRRRGFANQAVQSNLSPRPPVPATHVGHGIVDWPVP
jgi:hypothetical protein